MNITEDWFGLSRPVNLLPLDREVIKTQFILRTRDSYGVRNIMHRDLRDKPGESVLPISDRGVERDPTRLHGREHVQLQQADEDRRARIYR